MPSIIQVAALSDVGCVRTNNEDNFGYDPAAQIYVVCDGMGGMAAGEVASSIAVGTLISTFCAQPEETALEVRTSLAIRAANKAVCDAGEHEGQKGMGTTLVTAIFQDSKLLIGNVGDSRAYMLQNGEAMQLTLDHSYANELVRSGQVKLEDLPNLDLEGFASTITRAIGASHDVDPDFFFVDLKDGDTILLASDGLTRYVNGTRIAELIDIASLEESCSKLIGEAKSLGGADNITCVLLRYDAPTDAPSETAAEVPSTTAEDVTAEAVAPVEDVQSIEANP